MSAGGRCARRDERVVERAGCRPALGGETLAGARIRFASRRTAAGNCSSCLAFVRSFEIFSGTEVRGVVDGRQPVVQVGQGGKREKDPGNQEGGDDV